MNHKLLPGIQIKLLLLFDVTWCLWAIEKLRSSVNKYIFLRQRYDMLLHFLTVIVTHKKHDQMNCHILIMLRIS
jgi:hypothetical protein